VSDLFSEDYAKSYDTLYNGKDYAGESDALCRLIAKFGDGKVRRLLDLGCGTGRHAVCLTERGFEVAGIDQSEAMLTRAHQRANAIRGGRKIEFIHGDIRTFSAAQSFDSVLMNFNVLGYMWSNDDVLGALAAARRNVREGGLFIADFWYGPAVVVDPPGHRFRQIDVPEGCFLRLSRGQHVPEYQRCEISIKVLHLQKDRLVTQTEEVHRVRYFFPLELDLMLRVTGFRLLALTGFPDIENPASAREWVAAVTAVAYKRV
jgi:SAM-dependent methyltransferase